MNDIRTRTNEGHLELNVADLRGSGNRDLQRLAEADRASSTTLCSHGDDDGWLTGNEVHGAVGIHFMVREGYELLVEEAKRRGWQAIPATEIGRLMAEPANRLEREKQALRNTRPKEIPFDTTGRAALAEVMALKNGAPLPLAVLESHPINEVAESLVTRLGTTMKVPESLLPGWATLRLHEVRFDATREGMVQLYFPLKHGASIAQRGILNLHECPDTQDFASRSDWRDSIECNLARLRLAGEPRSELWNKLRPKSAILEIDWPDDLAFFSTAKNGGKRYGAAVAVMKTQVYNRITMTPHDSAALAPEKAYATPERLGSMVRPLSDGRTWVNGESTEYLEAQIWGEIGPDDIQEFWVPVGTAQAEIDGLAAHGHPVFAYSEESSRGYKRVRGDRLA